MTMYNVHCDYIQCELYIVECTLNNTNSQLYYALYYCEIPND